MRPMNPAVVLGLSPNGLGIVRSLHSVGIPVIGVDKRPDSMRDAHRWMSSHTRLCARKIFHNGGTNELLECLIALGRSLPAKGVIFPSGDGELLCISRHRDVLEPYFHFRIPSANTVELLANKARFYPFAERRGVAIPRTFIRPNPENIDAIAANIDYPCLIKANIRDNAWNRLYPRDKALPAEDRQTLLRLFDEVYPRYQNFLVQEVVPGPDSNLYFSHAYLSEDLRPLALWTGRKLRQGPIHFGTSTLTETAWVDEVASNSLALLRELNCVGYSSIEFKKDPRDGRYKIMEVTPGRTWYPHYLGIGAGINIPHIWYQDLLGIKQPDAARQCDGVRWIDEYRDVLSSISYWRHGELDAVGWARSLRGPRIYVYADWKDPVPLVLVAVRLLLAGPLQIARRLGL